VLFTICIAHVRTILDLWKIAGSVEKCEMKRYKLATSACPCIIFVSHVSAERGSRFRPEKNPEESWELAITRTMKSAGWLWEARRTAVLSRRQTRDQRPKRIAFRIGETERERERKRETDNAWQCRGRGSCVVRVRARLGASLCVGIAFRRPG